VALLHGSPQAMRHPIPLRLQAMRTEIGRSSFDMKPCLLQQYPEDAATFCIARCQAFTIWAEITGAAMAA
jgi:hypothetical protein